MDKGTGLETFFIKDFTVTTDGIMQYSCGSKQVRMLNNYIYIPTFPVWLQFV